MKINGKIIALAFAALTSSSAFSITWSTFNLLWSGAFYGNEASATGVITVDSAFLPSGDNEIVYVPSPIVSLLNITVNNSSGTTDFFKITDFDFIHFSTPAKLDLSRELIGQTLSTGGIYGTSDDDQIFGDFNVFGVDSGIGPQGSSSFAIRTFYGDHLLLTSIAPVPEPGTYALMGAGLLVLVFTARRRHGANGPNRDDIKTGAPRKGPWSPGSRSLMTA